MTVEGEMVSRQLKKGGGVPTENCWAAKGREANQLILFHMKNEASQNWEKKGGRGPGSRMKGKGSSIHAGTRVEGKKESPPGKRRRKSSSTEIKTRRKRGGDSRERALGCRRRLIKHCRW